MWFAVCGNWERNTSTGKETKLQQKIYSDCSTQEEALGKYVLEHSNAIEGYKLYTYQVTTFTPSEVEDNIHYIRSIDLLRQIDSILNSTRVDIMATSPIAENVRIFLNSIDAQK